MAFGDYVSLADVKTELDLADTDAQFDARILRLIPTCSRLVDRWCLVPSMYFGGAFETRIYDVPATFLGPTRLIRDLSVGESGGFIAVADRILTSLGRATDSPAVLPIDPMLAIPTEVAVDTDLDGTYVDTLTYLRDYDLLPINAPLNQDPYLELRALPNTALISIPVGNRVLRIKSYFGRQPPSASQQQLNLLGTVTGGAFTLSWNGSTTSAIAYNASASALQAALIALPGLATSGTAYKGETGVTVEGNDPLPNGYLNISLPGAQPAITVGANNLTGTGSPSVNLSAQSFAGPFSPWDIHEATLKTVIRFLKMRDAAPLGIMGSAETGLAHVGPDSEVHRILVDGGRIDIWGFV